MSNLGQSQFRELDPTAENINALVSASKVIALTVSTTDCNLNNFQSSLSGISTITVEGLNNNNPIPVTSIEAKEGYYYYNVVPFSISGELTGDSCLLTSFNPFVEAIGFANSDFNILFNNASSSRASNILQDVDRQTDSIKPSNFRALLSGSALKARTPDSYYTSLAHTSGRYVGSKTSVEDYGVSPALSVKFFDGASYLPASTTNYICSQSLADRDIQTFVFTGNFDYPTPDGQGSGSRIFLVEGNKALPVRSRKIWSKDTNMVFTTDEDGYTTVLGTFCST